jgi:hypothetical protein
MLSFCSECNRKIHTKTTGSILQHEIVSNVNREIALHAEKCDLHQSKDLNKYCFACEQTICEVCKSCNHEGHDVSSVVDVATARRKEMSLLLDRAWLKLGVAEEMAVQIESTINKISPHDPTASGKATPNSCSILISLVTNLDQMLDRRRGQKQPSTHTSMTSCRHSIFAAHNCSTEWTRWLPLR